ncbi:MAG: hypothetical protein ACRD2Y_12925 [Terriglobales bacterium]
MKRTASLARICLLVLLMTPLSLEAAWGNPDGTCANVEEISDTSLSCTAGTTTVGFQTGSIIGVWLATDNVDTTDGQTSLHSSVTDTDGNTYTKACEYTNGEGAAAAGATVSFWFSSVLTADLINPDTITINTASAVTDKAMNTEEFTIASGNVVSVEGACQVLGNDNADAGSQTISGLTSQEYLFVRAIGTESNLALSLTATASYTFVGSDGCSNTLSGGEATDIGECGEFRILTATGDTSDPTLLDTTNDNASVYLALKEAAPPAGPTGMPKRTIILP